MPMFLEEFDAKPLSGDEELTSSTSPKRFTVHNCWAWSSSDLLSNAKRGVFAESPWISSPSTAQARPRELG